MTKSIDRTVKDFQNTIIIAKHTLLPFWSQKRDCHSIFWRKSVDSLKTEHYEAPFLFSQWTIQLKTCFWCLFVCRFQFWIITFIRADTEKGPFSSNCSLSVSAPMYVMIQNWSRNTQSRFGRGGVVCYFKKCPEYLAVPIFKCLKTMCPLHHKLAHICSSEPSINYAQYLPQHWKFEINFIRIVFFLEGADKGSMLKFFFPFVLFTRKLRTKFVILLLST